MSSATELPTIRELEGLWYELQREMVAGSELFLLMQTLLILMVSQKIV
jgi:biopolymer transport protein ExbB